MAIEVTGRSAHIEVDEVWPEGREAALLAVATCWRLETLDASIDRLTAGARIAIERRERRARVEEFGPQLSWRELHDAGHALILDLPDFEGPLTDPARFTRSSAAAKCYRRLCGRLGLPAWRDRIDERAEVLEGTLAHLSERREHRQAMALQVGLEVLIIVLLAADLALSLNSLSGE